MLTGQLQQKMTRQWWLFVKMAKKTTIMHTKCIIYEDTANINYLIGTPNKMLELLKMHF